MFFFVVSSAGISVWCWKIVIWWQRNGFGKRMWSLCVKKHPPQKGFGLENKIDEKERKNEKRKKKVAAFPLASIFSYMWHSVLHRYTECTFSMRHRFNSKNINAKNRSIGIKINRCFCFEHHIMLAWIALHDKSSLITFKTTSYFFGKKGSWSEVGRDDRKTVMMESNGEKREKIVIEWERERRIRQRHRLERRLSGREDKKRRKQRDRARKR